MAYLKGTERNMAPWPYGTELFGQYQTLKDE